MKDLKIQEKVKIDMQLKNKKKVQKLKEKGITLIALVVTIIILLILAGVTLNMAMSGDGLFSKARNATEKYKKAQEDEVDLISEIGKEMNSEYVGAYIEGYEPTGGECEIIGNQAGLVDNLDNNGKAIDGIASNGNQIFKTPEGKLQWRIWDYDGTILRIILDKPTEDKFFLKGAEGYNNGVWIINEVCRKCFGQYKEDSETMNVGIDVANLNRSDIEEVSNYDYTKHTRTLSNWVEIEDTKGISDLWHYGEDASFSGQYPMLWKEKDSKWEYDYKTGKGDPSCENPWEMDFKNEKITGSGSTEDGISFKLSGYVHDYSGANEFKKSKFFDMIFWDEIGVADDSYTLPTRLVSRMNDKCAFCFSYVDMDMNRKRISTLPVFLNDGTEYVQRMNLRPIVSINLETSGYNIVKNDDGSGYTLKKN